MDDLDQVDLRPLGAVEDLSVLLINSPIHEVVAVQSGDLRVGDQVYGGFSGIGKGTARARSALIEQFQAWRRNNAGRLAPTGKAVSSGLYLLLVEDRA